jgi:hypothetical protein
MKKWHNANAETQTIYRKEYREANTTYFSDYSHLNKSKLNAKTRAVALDSHEYSWRN